MSLWEKFSTGANKGYDESINVLKGEKSIPKAMEDIKRETLEKMIATRRNEEKLGEPPSFSFY